MADFDIYEFESQMHSENKIKLWIDGVEIPYLSNYSYYDAKSFFKEPQRTPTGVLAGLNSYATFLTPRLQFSFKFMPIQAYRLLMRKIKEKNSFTIKAYDIVEDIYVTRKMYFEPKDFPQIYTENLETLAVRDEVFVLNGTNEELDDVSVIYNSNPPESSGTTYTTGIVKKYNDSFVVGEYEGEYDPFEFSYSGYKLLYYYRIDNNGTIIIYKQNDVIENLSNDLVLYAKWGEDLQHLLTFNYQGATGSETSRNINTGDTITNLPIPTKSGYVFGGWYTLPNGAGTLIENGATYTWTDNLTIYAKWTGATNTLTFVTNDDDSDIVNVSVASGEQYQIPQATFTKTGYEFIGWSTTSGSTTAEYTDKDIITMPNTDLTLYAVYKTKYRLTLNLMYNNNTSYIDGYIIQSTIIPIRQGYSFAGWYNENTYQTGVNFPLTMTENKEIFARWEINNE